jgi:hypothetical protein
MVLRGTRVNGGAIPAKIDKNFSFGQQNDSFQVSLSEERPYTCDKVINAKNKNY